MNRKSNGISWNKWCSVWTLAIILLSSGIHVDASKTKSRPRGAGGVSTGRVHKPSQNINHNPANPASLSYSPGDIQRHQARPVQSNPIPVQQARPVQSAPVPVAPPVPAQVGAVPHQASAPALPNNNHNQPIGWNVGEQRTSVNSVHSAPPPYPGAGGTSHGAPPPYQQGPPPAYSPHQPQSAYPGKNNEHCRNHERSQRCKFIVNHHSGRYFSFLVVCYFLSKLLRLEISSFRQDGVVICVHT